MQHLHLLHVMAPLHCPPKKQRLEEDKAIEICSLKSSLKYVVSQLKSLCKLLRAMQNNHNCCVQWRKIFPIPENLLQLILCKPFIHSLHKGHTHVHWCFYSQLHI